MSKSSQAKIFLAGGSGDIYEQLCLALFAFSYFDKMKLGGSGNSLKFGTFHLLWVLKIQIQILGGKNENQSLPYNIGSFELFGMFR